MAYKVSAQDGNWSTAATWNSVSNTPTIHGSTSLTISTTNLYSQGFTAPGTAGETSTGCLVYISGIGSAGTLTLQLQEATVDVALATASIDVSTLYPLRTVGSTGTLNCWVYFKWGTPYVYASAVAGTYRIRAVNAVPTGTTSFLTDSGAANFAFIETNGTTGAPAATDQVFIVGSNNSTAVNVTLDGTRTIGATSTVETGTIRSLRNGVSISLGGTLTFDNVASSTLTCNDNMAVGNQGSLIMSSTTDETKLITLQFGEPTAVGDYGLIIENSPLSVSLQGMAKTFYKTKYASGTGTVADPLITDDAVDWTVGDELLVTATSDNTYNTQETEYMVITTKNDVDSYVLTSANQIYNNSFDYNSGTNTFPNWTNGGTTANVAIENTIVHTAGGSSVKCTRTTSDGYLCQGGDYRYPRGTVIPGTTVNISFWVYGNGTHNARYRIYDATNAVDIVAVTSTGLSAAAWNEFTTSFVVPAGCYRALLYLYPPSTNTTYAYFDDVTITYTGLAATHTTDAHILNIQRNVLITSTRQDRGTYVNFLNRTVGAVDIDWVQFRWMGASSGGAKTGVQINGNTSTYGSGGTTAISSTAITQTANCDYSVVKEANYYGFYLANSAVTTTMTGNIACLSQSGSSLQFNFFSKNHNVVDHFIVSNYSNGLYPGGFLNTFTRCIVISCNTQRSTGTAGWTISQTGQASNSDTVDCESHCNFEGIRCNGYNLGTWKNFLCGTKGKNYEYDLYFDTAVFSGNFFEDCLFGSTNFVGNYLNALDGTSVRFIRFQDTDSKHYWITNYGIAQATGAGLTDTTVRTAGSLALRIAPEEATTGFSWTFKILAKASSAVSVLGFIKKNVAYATDVATVNLYLPGSVTPDATMNMPDDANWNVFNLAANYTGTVDLYATVEIIAKSATAGAYLYVDDIYNGTNNITAIDVWDAGQPSPIMFEQLGDAAAVWAVATSTLTTAGTTGKKLVDDLTVGKFLALK